jgi:predicted DNA-binding protein
MASKKTKASGRNIKESERGTEAKKFRLDHETAEDIEEMAEQIGCSQSQLVEAAVELFRAARDGEDVSELVHELIERAAAVSEAINDAKN